MNSTHLQLFQQKFWSKRRRVELDWLELAFIWCMLTELLFIFAAGSTGAQDRSCSPQKTLVTWHRYCFGSAYLNPWVEDHWFCLMWIRSEHLSGWQRDVSHSKVKVDQSESKWIISWAVQRTLPFCERKLWLAVERLCFLLLLHGQCHSILVSVT